MWYENGEPGSNLYPDPDDIERVNIPNVQLDDIQAIPYSLFTKIWGPIFGK